MTYETVTLERMRLAAMQYFTEELVDTYFSIPPKVDVSDVWQEAL